MGSSIGDSCARIASFSRTGKMPRRSCRPDSRLATSWTCWGASRIFLRLSLRSRAKRIASACFTGDDLDDDRECDDRDDCVSLSRENGWLVASLALSVGLFVKDGARGMLLSVASSSSSSLRRLLGLVVRGVEDGGIFGRLRSQSCKRLRSLSHIICRVGRN